VKGPVCYAGRYYLLYESELSLTFGTHLVAGKRSDRGGALRLENSERFLGSSAEVDRILLPGRVSDQSGGHRRGTGLDSAVASESSGDL
jgi:hypothetical protein